MRVAYLFLFLIVLSATSCQSTPQYLKLGRQEMFSFAREVEVSDQLELLGYGGGFYDGIDNFSLTFWSPAKPTVSEARTLFFDISNRFLERVNQHEALRGYLVNYPFTIDNLDLMIVFPKDINGSIHGVGMGESFQHIKRNFILYDGYNPSKQRFEVIFKETYQEGLERYEHRENLKETPTTVL